MPKKLLKLNGEELTYEEKKSRKNYVDMVRQRILRNQLEGELQNYVDKYDEEHEYMIKEYDFKVFLRKTTEPIREPIRSEIRYEDEEEEEPRSVYSQYGRIKKRLPQKPKSSLSHVIDGLFGESKTSPELDVIRSDVSETDNPKKANPLTKSISNAVEGWKMLFRLLKGETIEKELGEEKGDTI